MDPAGLAIGVAGLGFQFFHAASSAYETIASIQSFGKDSTLLQTRFHIEQIKFETWAEEVGLHAQSPESFERQFQGKRTHYIVILDILRQICNLITNHRDLERTYGLKSASRRGTDDLSADLDAMLTEEPTTTLHAVLLSHKAQTDWENSLMRIQQRTSLLKRAKWELCDKKKFSVLIDNLGYLNAGLKEILPRIDQGSFERALIYGQPSGAAQLQQWVGQLRQLKEDKSTFSDPDPDNSLYIDAALFKNRVVNSATGEDDDSGDSERGKKSKKGWDLLIDPGCIELVEDSSPLSDRCITELNHKKGVKQVVLVETKTLTAAHSKQKDIFGDRIKRLVELLHAPPQAEVYRVLDCVGCVQDTDKNGYDRYRLLFSLPPALATAPNPGYFTLYSLLRDSRNNKTPVNVSLGNRLRLAALVASSISYIHAAGWLHHNLSSHNVLCFSPNSDHQDISTPYLAGFGFARFDDPKEISEIDTASASDLYRHPDYRTAGSPKTRYRRSYELYSLGVVLIEIAFWKRIETFWSSSSMNARAFATHLQTKVAELLGYHMGEAYRMATLCCLNTDMLGVGSDEGRKLSEAFSRRVVRELESCRV